MTMPIVSEATSPLNVVPLRDFRILWLGQLLSSIGGPFQVIAIAMWTLESGRGATALALVVASGTVSQLVGTLLSGPLVDRHGALRVIQYSDMVRFVLTSLLAATLILELDTFIVISIVSVSGVIWGIFRPALRSAPGTLLRKEDQPRGNGLMEVSNSSSMLIGTLAGGLMVALTGPVAAIIFNASSFAIGVFCVALVRRRYGNSGRKAVTDNVGALIRAGLAYVWRNAWLRTFLLVDAVLDLVTAGQLSVGLPAISRQMSGASSLGLMLAGFGAGSLIGALLSSRLPKFPIAPLRMVYLLQLLAAPFLGVLPLSNLPTAVACLAVAGLLNTIASVQYLSIIQRNVDAAMLGRVMALLMAAGLSVQPIGQILCGILIERGWMQECFTVGMAIMVVVCILGMARRNLSKLA